MMTFEQANERRKADRVKAQTTVRYRDTAYRGALGFWEGGELLDLSMAGARIKTALPLKPGARIDVRLEMHDPGAQRVLVLPSECVRAQDGEVALRFAELDEASREALGKHLAQLALLAVDRNTRKRPPRVALVLDPGRTTQVL